jgi:hypothetical protein
MVSEMTIQDWGSIGEIIGGIAVLATVVYLAIQLRQSTQATHRHTYNAAADSMAQFSWNLAKNPYLQKLYRNMLSTPDSLTADELLQAETILDAYLTLMESYYLHNIQFGETLSQARWGRILTRIFATPGGQRYWAQRRWQFHEDFANYVDALMTDER